SRFCFGFHEYPVIYHFYTPLKNARVYIIQQLVPYLFYKRNYTYKTEVFRSMKPKNLTHVGKSEKRVDISDKAFGRVKYTGDVSSTGMLHAKMQTSCHAHATIQSINKTKAWKVPGVHAILTGDDFPFPVGP